MTAKARRYLSTALSALALPTALLAVYLHAQDHEAATTSGGLGLTSETMLICAGLLICASGLVAWAGKRAGRGDP